jgi:P4 family phage/plasmid primase-like protien
VVVVSDTLDWEQLLNDVRGFAGIAEDEPVPRGEIIEQLKAEGYDENEARDLFREEPGFVQENDDLSNPLVTYDSSDAEPEVKNGTKEASDQTPPGELLDGEYPEPWVSESRWFCWSYDEGRKIPRAPWHEEEGSDEENYWDSWKSWKEEDVWTTFEEAAEWVNKLPDYRMATAIPEVEDNNEVRSVLVDFDDVRDPETGEVHEGVEDFVTEHRLEDAPLYESTSGTGYHKYLRGELPKGVKPSAKVKLDDEPFLDPEGEDEDEKLPEVEIYASSRFVAVSGELAHGEAEIPRDDDAVESMFTEHGEEKSPTEDRDPELDREEVEDLDTTRDIDEIYDAIQHITPRDIRLKSDAEERPNGIWDIDPSWENSDSGSRVGYDDGWIHRKENTGMDALQVVALEEREINSPAEYPEGEDFFRMLDELRSRGAHIPEYDDKEVGDIGDGLSDRDEEGGDGDGDEDTGPHPVVSELRAWLRKFEESKDRRPRLGEKAARAESALLDHIEFRYVPEEERLWRWDSDERVWKHDGEDHITDLIKDGFDSEWSTRVDSAAIERVSKESDIHIDHDEFELSERTFPVENGLYDIETGEVREREPEDYVKKESEVPYRDGADAPEFRGFLQDVVPTGGERKKLQEYAGYCLLHNEIPYHKALFLAGPQASGKSTFIDVISKVLPDEAVGASTPQQLTQRFGKECLSKRWLNKSPDIPAEDIDNLGVFKMIVGDDQVDGEIKNVHEKVTFRPTAKHIFSANQLPDIYDTDEAFWRRVLIVRFPDTVPKEDRVDNYDDYLFEKEASGILNWMIEGLGRLLDQGGFSADLSNEKTQERWSMWGTSVVRWKARRTRMDIGGGVIKSAAYDDYKQFCLDHDLTPVAYGGQRDDTFGGRLKRFPHIGDTKIEGEDGKKKGAYSNIELVPDAQVEDGGEDDTTAGGQGRWQG